MKDRRVFVDTNIFVYAKLQAPQTLSKHRRAIQLLETLSAPVIVSVQVLNEFSSVLLKHKVPDTTILEAVKAIAANSIITPLTWMTIEHAWGIKGRYQLAYWDSLIVSTALEAACTVLYSEDLQHQQIIEGVLQIINPFVK